MPKYKDGLFRSYFNDEKRLLNLKVFAGQSARNRKSKQFAVM